MRVFHRFLGLLIIILTALLIFVLLNMKDLHKLFLEIWDEREENGYVICFETGVKLKREYFRKNSACYSHILPKSKYPQYAMVKKNIEIVHPDAHGTYENNCDKAPKQCQRKKELLAMHYLGNLV